MPISLFLDIIVAILLVMTIGYAVVLNRRLAVLRQDRDELERLAAEFASATVRADEGVRRLKGTADELGAMMDTRISKAQGLKEDLDYLIDRANSVADKLESSVRTTRKDMPQDPLPEMDPDEEMVGVEPAGLPEEEEVPARSEAELELLKALQSVK
ncbi:DUF6468 domain-containing protein [Magnetospira sp. QH-2]|uniref:DUF6468 domain-containing protein n=1 Tax=Magnetospira sp. (strain QH-2) TaxID=1288970 RepID=UPI0003E81AA3|nr:DUF6468 domain-containing protein [Magnetospira sp. QH-2]CCQ74121.1 conserved protein of unknown function [Magnetospira sp. QH-2]